MELDATIIAHIDEWLDNGVASHYPPLAQDWARVAKCTEESGEAIAELISWTGQNPRKGDPDLEAFPRMLKELADTALTAILAIQHFTKDSDYTALIVEGRLDGLYRRII